MTTTSINILLLLLAFISMEAIAWFTHKFIMHGPLWKLHRDHHKKETNGFLEHNDLFFLIFALPGILCLYIGSQNNYNFFFWIGMGISLYGLAYFLIHDLFIHRRLKLFKNTHNSYFRAIRRAHKTHHKHLEKKEGECFGMLWVPLKFFETDR